MNKSQIENCVFRDSAITIDGSDDLSVKKNIYIGSERSGGMLDLKNIKKAAIEENIIVHETGRKESKRWFYEPGNIISIISLIISLVWSYLLN